MRTWKLWLLLNGCCTLLPLPAAAGTHYVWRDSPNPAPPFSDWSTAAHTIQDAVDAAQTGETILVTNGVYATGGRAVAGIMTNRVAVRKPITLKSVNGPQVTAIQGYQVPGTTNGDGAVRCVYLTNGAVLSGFTLTNGATRAAGDAFLEECGGGAWCESGNARLTNCFVTANSAYNGGGGTYSGTLNNCTVASNSASSGGGACSGTLNQCALLGNTAVSSGGGTSYAILNGCIVDGNSGGNYGGGANGGALTNCTLTSNLAVNGGGSCVATLYNCAIVGNSAMAGGGDNGSWLVNCTLTGNSTSWDGGGAYGSTLINCIIYYNTGGYNPNYNSTALAYCCTTPMPVIGEGNIIDEPQLASAFHLSAGSPCRGAGGSTYKIGRDIDGEPWLNPPSTGCDEYRTGFVTGDLTVAIGASRTNVAAGVMTDLTGEIGGKVAASVWDFGDGTVVSNRPYASHAWGAVGDYAVVLWAYNESHPEGVSATLTIRVVAPVHYVTAASANPVPPYYTWATAARTIQDAVDATLVPGAIVLVTNGVFATGGRAVAGLMTNRVVVDRPVVVQSVNGPEVTTICGYPVPGRTNGDGAIRCVYLTNGAVLSGFTLTKGATRAAGDAVLEQCGGGAWCESTSALVTNCMLTANTAEGYGGGVYSGTINNCMLSANSAGSAGGVYSSTLNNCVLTGNSAWQNGGGAYSGTLKNCTLTGNLASMSGGGAYDGTLDNCILYYNTAGSGSNYSGSTLNYCCTTPLPGSGTGNISAEPQLASFLRLSAGSPCRGAGSAAYATGVDIDGEAWLTPPSIGCDEYQPAALTGALTVAIGVSWTNVGAGYSLDLLGQISGRVTASVWDFGDGNVLSNRPYASHAWAVAGDYPVVLRAYDDSHPEGVSAVVTIRVVAHTTHYVSAASVNPAPPYYTWATAAQTIQEAVDAAQAGDTILVTNGVYVAGGRAVWGLMTNRIAVDKPMTLQSVNGPQVTVIQGYQVPGTTNGDGAIRCVYLTNGAVLSGFTLTHGATRTNGDAYQELSGGGILCESTSAMVSNCVLTGNSAALFGGGVSGGTINGCTLTWNSGQAGGGVYGATLTDCSLAGNSAHYGGGGFYSSLNHCILTGNLATGAFGPGGGAMSSSLDNCTLTGNSASLWGGGAYDSLLTNCTLAGNSAFTSGGGAKDGTLNNCILYFNVAPDGPNWSQSEFSGPIDFSCTAPLPSNGSGNITNEPKFVDLAGGNLRLQSDSPCINSGHNAGVTTTTDLDGNERIVGGTVDMGAYEWVAVPTHYVSANSAAPVSPYRSWSSAARTIQDAIDAAAVGEAILVTNGVYATGGRAVHGLMTNRVTVRKPITLQSVNGPGFTIIQGSQVPGTTNGNGAVRCVYLTNGATLSGFTLTNGATRSAGDDYHEESGGGLWCENPTVTVSNCVVAGNSAYCKGGGVVGGTLIDCTIARNSAWGCGETSGGGSYLSTLRRCTLTQNSAYRGGGAYGGMLAHCTLAGNWATSGGGVFDPAFTLGPPFTTMLDNCSLAGNSALTGGGTAGGTLNNCTLTGNSAVVGGGACKGTLNNSIAYGNTAQDMPNYGIGLYLVTLNYCCTTPRPTNGMANITDAPLFVDPNGGNFHLQSNSPCINAGNNAYVTTTTDLDGNPRLALGTVDLGAYEFQGPGSTISYAWLRQYELPTDGSADYVDTDGDLLNNWQEWMAGTNPTNAASCLRLTVLFANPWVFVGFSSSSNRLYTLFSSSNLTATPPGPVWNPVPDQIDRPGTGGLLILRDTNPPAPAFYRVSVSIP